MKTRVYYELYIQIKLNDIKSRIKWIFCDHNIVECWWSECPVVYTSYMCKKCRIQMRQYWKNMWHTIQSNYRDN